MITDARITDSSCLGGGLSLEKCRYCDFFFKVRIKKDKVEEFNAIAQLELREPPKIQMN